MSNLNGLGNIEDSALLLKFAKLVQSERDATALVVSHLAEIGRRKLYLREGYDSLFRFCVEKYHLSEGATYRRITASRLSIRFPQVLQLLKKGHVSLTSLTLVSKYLTEKNKDKLLSAIQNRSKTEIESILVNFQLRNEKVVDKIRNLPSPANHRVEKQIENQITKIIKFSQNKKSIHDSKKLIQKTAKSLSKSVQRLTLASESFELKKAAKHTITPIVPSRVKVEFEVSGKFSKKLLRAKEVLSHKYPQGKLEDIFEEALDLLLKKKDRVLKLKKAENKVVSENALKQDSVQTKKPLFLSRQIPIKTRKEIFQRDKGICTFQTVTGRRCRSPYEIEIDHIKPWSMGGDHSIKNLRLLCRAHNQGRINASLARRH